MNERQREMRSYGLAISGSDSCFYIPQPTSHLHQKTHTRPETQLPLPKTRFFVPERIRVAQTRSQGRNQRWGHGGEHKELTFYELLGIPESGSVTQIKQAYKLLARKYHPDVSPLDRVEENTEKFIRVQEAYETLSDSRRRAMYDRDMARGLHLAFSARRCQYDE
ncbi:DNAJ-like 20, partial [Prunus dulcis]